MLMIRANEQVEAYLQTLPENGNVKIKRKDVKLVRRTPRAFWEAAVAYFDEYALKERWSRREVVRAGTSAGGIVKIPAMQALTQQALCIFLGISMAEFSRLCGIGIEEDMSEALKREYKLYKPITEVIRSIMYTVNCEGASMGALSASVIANLASVRDKYEKEASGAVTAAVVQLKNITGMEIL